MEPKVADQLYADGLLSDASYEKLKRQQLKPLISIHWELRTLLYVGILLLTSGLGILVYKNINTIGHGVVLAFIAIVFIACFIYCFKNRAPFSKAKTTSPTAFFNYILLLGTICLLIFIAYLQYQHQVFGLHYGLATLIPMLLLFYIAYDFDHTGILNMAIINLGLWMGVTVTPQKLLVEGTFSNTTIAATYLVFGLLLITIALVTRHNHIKPHFEFSYRHYGIHASFIALLAGYFINYDSKSSLLWLLALFILAALLFRSTFRQKSFYFLLLLILYSYVAINSLMIRLAIGAMRDGAMYLLFLYFIASAIGLIFLLIYLNKKIKAS